MIKLEGPLWVITCTIIGALVLWCKEPPDRLRVYYLSDITDRIPKESWRYWIQLAVFLTLGTLVALVFTNPTTPAQGLASGLGWTALITKSSEKKRSPPRRKKTTKADEINVAEGNEE